MEVWQRQALAAAAAPAAAGAAATIPSRCQTIEEVGNTGVGAFTVAFLALIVTTITLAYKSYNATSATRKFYVLTTFICGFSSMIYFALLSGQGWTTVLGYDVAP
jgi:bacteriorhodopsin